MNTYGERLTFAIEQAESSQSALAREAGIKQQSVQYLCGPKAQGSKHTPTFAHILKVRTEWLATGEGPIREVDILDLLPPRERSALMLFRGLTPEQQDKQIRDLESTQQENIRIYKALSSQYKEDNQRRKAG